MRKILLLCILFPYIALCVLTDEYEIAYIKPIFPKEMFGFGDFKIKVGIKNKENSKKKLIVTCLYTGLTHPGFYFKNEPIIMKGYKIVEINPLEEKEILFNSGFVAYHPETVGEIIVSIVGTGVVHSLFLKTRFHPESQD